MRFLNDNISIRDASDKMCRRSITPIELLNAKQQSSPVKSDSKNDHQRKQKRPNGYNDVWYRRFMKPLARSSHAAPYKKTFQQRVLRPVGIPVAEMKGIHELFRPSYRRYSPLQGLLFNYNNFINNLYRYGDSTVEPAVELIRKLFHALPGGEITTTHLGSVPEAHLTASIIGDMFVKFEELKPILGDMPSSEREAKVAVELLVLVSDHADYHQERDKLKRQVQKARLALAKLKQRDRDSKPVRQKIKKLEGDVIKRAKHKIKRIQQKLSSSIIEDDERERLLQDVAKNQKAMEDTQQEVSVLRKQIVTSLDFKTTRKALRRAEEALELEQKNRASMTNTLARCFCTYDLEEEDGDASGPDTVHLFAYTTTAVLLAYLWRKYDSIEALEGYFESIEGLGALSVSIDEARSLLHVNTSNETSEKVVKSRRAKRWSAGDVESAAVISVGKPGLNKRPPVIQFSYVTWAAYSEFPDCGETALRNLFNQILYNPETGSFDYDLLAELKKQYYPDLKDKLTDFYRNHSEPQDSLHQEASVDWIEVSSHLNEGRDDSSLLVRYRREMQQKNIASPLSNLLRVINALFGIQDLDKDSLPEIASHINELRGEKLKLHIDTSGVAKDGFGIVNLSAENGKVRYELQSYKPVHFGFVLAETSSDSAGQRQQRDYEVFHQLKRYAEGSARNRPADADAYLEQLALASLFVPYQLQRHKIGRFFRENHAPLFYQMLFADLNTPLQKQAAFKWVKEQKEELSLSQSTNEVRNQRYLFSIIENVRSYKEPSFMPSSQRAASSE